MKFLVDFFGHYPVLKAGLARYRKRDALENDLVISKRSAKGGAWVGSGIGGVLNLPRRLWLRGNKAIAAVQGIEVAVRKQFDKVFGHAERLVLEDPTVRVGKEPAWIAAPKFLDEKFAWKIDYVPHQVLHAKGERKRAARDSGRADGLPDFGAVVGKYMQRM
jgi:hypothetical protein